MLDHYSPNVMRNLRSGSLSLQYSAGSLWNICLGTEEVVRRIYLVFQDINWTSRPFEILNEKWDIQEDSFAAVINLCGTHDAQSFQVKLIITGSPSGEISYGFSGRAFDNFMRNRLGLCLLHPIKHFASKACTLTLMDGSSSLSQFPDLISPHQPFKQLSGISHKTLTGKEIKVEFTGEVFETEDHRNWSDASYKTYCTPIELPFPVQILKGEQINQEIRVSLFDDNGAPSKATEKKTIISVSDSEVDLPNIGLNFPEGYSDSDHDKFGELGIEHLRLAVDLDNFSIGDILKAIEISKRLNLNFDLAITARNCDQIKDFIIKNLKLVKLIRNCLIFSKVHKVTPEEFISTIREVMGSDVEISGGTNFYFTEINRGQPVVSGIDQINFSLNPQVHSFDDRTLIQNLATQQVIAMNAARIAGVLGVSVGPISLLPRFNPNATEPERDVSNTALPASVDIRQLGWFAEAWTAISIKYLSQSAKIKTATYFETVGWRGIRESVAGSRDPINFPSNPGEPFPIWKLFASLKGFNKCVLSNSNFPEMIDSLIIRNSLTTRLILVNFTNEANQVYFDGIELDSVTLPPLSTTYMDI